MDFKKSVKNALDIVQLKDKAISSVASAKDSFLPSVLILVIAGIAMAIGSMNPIGIIGNPIGYFIMSFIGVGILFIFAKLFGGKGNYMPHYNALAHGYILMWISVIPFIGPMIAAIAGLWSIVVAVKVTSVVHRLSIGKSALVVLIPIIIIAVLMVILVMIMGAVIMGALLGGMMQ